MANQEKEVYPAAAQFILHDFYVDDGLASVDSVEQGKGLIQGAREICKSGSLRLHKFLSNDCSLMESVPKSGRAVDINSIESTVRTAPDRKCSWCTMYTCQLSHLRREPHACGLKTSISCRLTLAGQFLMPD